MTNCSECEQAFEIDQKDLEFYDKVSPNLNGKKYPIPAPKACPNCRQKRRLASYNRRKLYKRKCDKSGEEMLSIYSSDKPFKVYKKDVWFSDDWDPMEYGRDFDPSRPFFEQFRELMEATPQLGLSLLGETINSDYNNDCTKLHNCYLVFDGGAAKDCMYGETFVDTKDCMDFKYTEKCDFCYEIINCTSCYNLKYSRFCKTCSESYFLRDCSTCNNCFCCANLHQKNYCIFNEQKTQEEYEAFMKKIDTASYKQMEEWKKKAEEFFLTQPVRAVHGTHNDNTVGDNLNHCKNAYKCFDSNNLQDCEYISDDQVSAKDSYDLDVWGEGVELCYNSTVIGIALRNVISGLYVSEGGYDIYYSQFCSRSSNNLFGCTGLRHKSFCILNKQYTEEEYYKIVDQIITQMVDNGTWGDYFPIEISAFGYNETVAQEYYPMTKEEVLKKGWKWKDQDKIDYEAKITKKGEGSELPDNIKDVKDNILDWAIICENSDRLFKLEKKELDFYRKYKIPLPHLHPDERHLLRVAKRNPHHLWKRPCAKCGKETESSYDPDRKETIYCEECYRDLVF